MTEQTVTTTSSIRSIFEKFSTTKDTSLVYGDPIHAENKTILPVAKVRYSVGGGSGFGKDHGEPSGGEGAGGMFRVKPLGVYEITETKTIYKPIVPLEIFFLFPLAAVAFALIFSSKQKS